MGTAELVACAVALRSDRGRLSHAKHGVDKCRKGASESSFCESAQRKRSSPGAISGTGAADSSGWLFPSESPALENFHRLSRSRLCGLAHKNVCAPKGTAYRRTAR